MNSLFGIPMNMIALVLAATLAVCLLAVAWIYLRERVLFAIGVRNIPRRRAQTVLIIIGLMLSTLIISAAFTTGDTLNYSVTKATYDILGPIDETIQVKSPSAAANRLPFFPASVADALKTNVSDPSLFDGWYPFILTPVPGRAVESQLTKPDIGLVGIDSPTVAQMGGLPGVDGRRYSPSALGPDEVYVNAHAADALNLGPGAHLTIVTRGQPHTFTVRAVLENELLTGQRGGGPNVPQSGIVMPLDRAQSLLGETGKINVLGISNRGNDRAGVTLSDQAKTVLSRALDTPAVQQVLRASNLSASVETTKQQAVHTAELLGSIFTTLFLVIGLFSIASGIMLIFLIFVMLASERKVEMGISRAVGMRRGQLTQTYIAEGMLYDLGAALVGVALGVGVAFGLVVLGTRIVVGGRLPIVAHVTLRSLLVSYCLGAVLTFITVAVSAGRVSQLNIVAAIRDLPDGGAIREPFRRRRWGDVGLGVLLLVSGIVGVAALVITFALLALPQRSLRWRVVAALRETFGRRKLLTLAVLVLGGLDTLSMALGWALLLNLVMIVAIVIAAFVILRGLGVPWLLVLGPVGLLGGGAMILAGIRAQQLFPVMAGLTLIPFSLAFLARWLGASSRLGYSIAGAVVLVLWLLPEKVTGGLFGHLSSNLEMFFLSGLAITVASALVIAFNADRLALLFGPGTKTWQRFLPAVLLGMLAAALLGVGLGAGSQVGDMRQLLIGFGVLSAVAAVISLAGTALGRFTPAIKMAMAYPLASRFRTGMIVAMFTLIVFSLVVMNTINLNFGRAFLTTTATGGWDVAVTLNPNNPMPDLLAKLGQVGVDTSAIAASGGVTPLRSASPLKLQNAGQSTSHDYPVRTIDAAYARNAQTKLQARAAGYPSDQAAWEALAADPGVAVIDAQSLQSGPFAAGEFNFRLAGIKPTDTVIGHPPEVLVRDPITGRSAAVRVIGVISQEVFFDVGFGLYVSPQTYQQLVGPPAYLQQYLRTKPGTNNTAFAKQIEAALSDQGVQAQSVIGTLREQQSLSRGFNAIFAAFAALGLVVGVAGLSVIAFRSVIERRQHIGVLRAVGYTRRVIALTYLMESSFVAILGILAGIVGGVVLTFNLWHSSALQSQDLHVAFAVPWASIALYAGLGYLFSLLFTLIPARNASRVPVAEALRYE